MLQEFSFLIPVVRNGNRQLHHSKVWTWLESWLLKRFGGFSTDSEPVRGSWRSDAGEIVNDQSDRYYVALDPEKADVSHLRQLLAVACDKFDQECIYLRHADGSVEFVEFVDSVKTVS